MVNAYCEDCDWTAAATEDEHSRQELNRAMIDHFVETGHTLVSSAASDVEGLNFSPVRERERTTDETRPPRLE